MHNPMHNSMRNPMCMPMRMFMHTHVSTHVYAHAYPHTYVYTHVRTHAYTQLGGKHSLQLREVRAPQVQQGAVCAAPRLAMHAGAVPCMRAPQVEQGAVPMGAAAVPLMYGNVSMNARLHTSNCLDTCSYTFL